MKIIYDQEKDILQIAFRNHTVAETAQIAPDFILDYDEDGQVIGLEIRSASEHMDTSTHVTYETGKANLEKPQPYTGVRS